MTAAAASKASCTWLRDHGLLEEESGQTIDAHLSSCPPCTQLHLEFATLRRSINELPGPAPAAGWQRKVWQRIDAGDRQRAPAPWMRWLQLAAPVVAVAAVLLLLIWDKSQSPQAPSAGDEPLTLAYRIERDANRPRVRGDVTVGDTVVLESSGPLSKAADLRIYREGLGIVFRCADAPVACARSENQLRARFTIPSIGRYRAMIVSAPTPLIPPSGILDDDVAAIGRQPGAVMRWADAFEVW